MSNSILLHTQNIKGIDYTATHHKGNTIVYEAVMRTENHKGQHKGNIRDVVDY